MSRARIDIPRDRIADFCRRNCLIHGYDAVDLDILWTIVQDDLSSLITELRRILNEQAK